jgi:hypothetical protein
VKRRPPAPLEPLTVLTRPELAKWLKVCVRTIDRLQPPALTMSEGVRRYLVADVLTWLHRDNGRHEVAS